jgi:hypothetical protein
VDFLGLGNTPNAFQKPPYLLLIAPSVFCLSVAVSGLDGRPLNELQSEIVLLQTGIAYRV